MNTNSSHNSLPGYGIDFGDMEARLALAIKASGIGTGGGSGGSSSPQTFYTTYIASNSDILVKLYYDGNNYWFNVTTNTMLPSEPTVGTFTEVNLNLNSLIGSQAALSTDSSVSGTVLSRIRGIQQQLESVNLQLNYVAIVTNSTLGYSVGDTVVKYVKFLYEVSSVSWFNLTTDTALTSVDMSELSTEQVYSQQAIFNNTVAGSLITETTRRLASLHIWNELDVQPHYVGILPSTGGTQLITSFYNPGNAGLTLLIDDNYFRTLTIKGFQVVRSSNPLTFTQLANTLSNPSGIRVTI